LKKRSLFTATSFSDIRFHIAAAKCAKFVPIFLFCLFCIFYYSIFIFFPYFAFHFCSHVSVSRKFFVGCLARVIKTF